MKVALVHSNYSSGTPSGENIVVADQAEALASLPGVDVTVLTRDTDALMGSRGYQLRSAYRTATGRGWNPISELKRLKPDIVHVHNTYPNMGTRWMADWRGPLVVTLHNYRTVCAAATLRLRGEDCTRCLKFPAAPAIMNRCYKDSAIKTVPVALGTAPHMGLRSILDNASTIITLNPDATQFYQRITHVKVMEVRNFSSTVPSVMDASRVQRRWLFAGRMVAEKGLERLLSVWPASEVLHLFGGGDQEAKLRDLYGDRPNIIWRGRLERRRLLREIPSFTGLMLPSQWGEGVPTIMLEALRAGVPVVAAREVSVGPELASASVGTVCSFDDPEELLRCLELVDSVVYRSAALEYSLKHYSENRWKTEILRVYSALMAGSPHE